MEQWIILGVAIVSLLISVCFLVWYIVKTNYPEGHKITRKWNKRKVNLIIHNKAQVPYTDQLADACLNVVKALVSTHTIMSREGYRVSGSADFKEYSVYIVPETLTMHHVKSFTRTMDGVPTCVVSDRFWKEIMETGEPVIHEACHTVLNDYIVSHDDYSDSTIWAAKGGDLSLQHAARGVYKTINLAN